MDIFAIFLGKMVSWLSKILNFGAGATWPGEIALRLSPHILSRLLLIPKKGIIIVAGTNGKTTTASMIVHLLKKNGNTVIRNESGANLINGLVSCLLGASSDTEYAVFEVDENALPILLKDGGLQKYPKAVTIILLNLFRDQLDRYGEVDTIAEHWRNALSDLKGNVTLIANADDPQISSIALSTNLKKIFIGLGDTTYYLPHKEHATDSIYCPSCGKRLTFDGVYFSHLGTWHCDSCGLKEPKLTRTSRDVVSPLEGVYNIYNAIAACALGTNIGLTEKNISTALSTFIPAFGRMETIAYKGKRIKILLSKNPTGFNQSIRTVQSSDEKGPLLVLLNDRIPDGRDVSWIWDVDFEMFSSQREPIVVSGDRAHDMAVRIKYALDGKTDKRLSVIPELDEAVTGAVEMAKSSETVWVLATYSAMLDVRKILTGKKIL